MVGCENKLHSHDQMKPEKNLSLGKMPQDISVFSYVKSLKKLAVVALETDSSYKVLHMKQLGHTQRSSCR